MRGFVYVLANDHMPGVVKVGRTAGSPYERAAELSRPTGIPAPFRVVAYAETGDAADLEHQIHADLAPWRLKAREFFEACNGRFDHVVDALLSNVDAASICQADSAWFSANRWDA